MTGHMALPKITDDDVPSSLSRRITTDLLRNKLGYEQGVIVTDCLEMQAVLDNYGTAKGAVMSLQAGADVVMICHTFPWQRQAIEEVYRALETGDISLEALKVSGDRVKKLKEKFVAPPAQGGGVIASAPPPPGLFTELKRNNKALSADAYADSIALSEASSFESSSVIPPFQPLAPGKSKVALFTPVMETLNKAVDDADGVLRNQDPAKGIRNTAGASYLSFFQSIKARASAAEHIVYTQEDINEQQQQQLSVPADVDAIIFTTRNAGRSPWQVDYLQRLASAIQGVPIIGVASCEPYDLALMKKFGIPTLATFEFTSPALEAAAAVIFGEKEAMARLPVQI
jgi:beta-N-acetylhexosaminidase